MTEVSCAADELTLLERLREIPSGAAREALFALLDDLMAFTRDPRCAGFQGDGAPCGSVEIACEDCRQVVATLRSMQRRLRQF